MLKSSRTRRLEAAYIELSVIAWSLLVGRADTPQWLLDKLDAAEKAMPDLRQRRTDAHIAFRDGQHMFNALGPMSGELHRRTIMLDQKRAAERQAELAEGWNGSLAKQAGEAAERLWTRGAYQPHTPDPRPEPKAPTVEETNRVMRPDVWKSGGEYPTPPNPHRPAIVKATITPEPLNVHSRGVYIPVQTELDVEAMKKQIERGLDDVFQKHNIPDDRHRKSCYELQHDAT